MPWHGFLPRTARPAPEPAGAGLRPSLTGIQAYAAAKHALVGLTKQLSWELGPHGVTVNAVMPGQVATPGTEQYNDEAAFDATMAAQAIRRRVQPEDLAGLVSFLAGPDARMVTGQTIICDGGGHLH